MTRRPGVLAYGLLAINLNHYSNKASYRPDSVIALVDKSFASNNDDALFRKGIEAVDRAIAVASNHRLVVDDPELAPLQERLARRRRRLGLIRQP